jgi:phosphoglycerate dehydrogenase-like enzyme
MRDRDLGDGGRREALRAIYVDVDELGVEPGRSLLEGAGFEVLEAQCHDPSDLIKEAGAGVSALLVNNARITRNVLAALQDVGIVSTRSVGTDHVDLEAARDLGVWVCNVPDAATDEVAVHALAMALALVRHLPFFDREVRRGIWAPSGAGPMMRPTSMTLGVVGMGRIGQSLAKLARPLFARIMGCDPFIPLSSWPPAVERADPEELFRRSDIVSLHVPLTLSTRGLVDAERLRIMRAGSYVVNVSRGDLVDLSALVSALDSGHLAGAALDVLPEEPPRSDLAILRHPRVLLTPHVAYLSEASAVDYVRKQAMNVVAWAKSGRPKRVVTEPPVPRFGWNGPRRSSRSAPSRPWCTG